MPPRQHPVLERLSDALPGPAPIAGLPPAPDVPELVALVGYISGTVTNPATDSNWLLVYRDWRMTTWYLIEGPGHRPRRPCPGGGRPRARS